MTQRRRPTPNEMVILLAEVERLCPLCKKPLIYSKNGQYHKSCDVAHIYPLSPTPEEIEELKNLERLCDDVNHADNLVPLCKLCHTKFDRPRTAEEYVELLGLKKDALARSERMTSWTQFSLQEALYDVVQRLLELSSVPTPAADNVQLSYDPKTIDEKTDGTLGSLIKSRIHDDVRGYFVFLRQAFSELEETTSGTAEQIALEIRLYYIEQRKSSNSQQVIFENIADWIEARREFAGPHQRL